MDAPEVLETQETEQETVQTPEPEAPQVDEEKESMKARLEELEKKNKQLYERVKKAESSSKKNDDAISNKDLLYLAKADIPAEDVDEVVTYAKKMGVDIQTAHQFYSPILKERAEERKTAAATQTRGARGTAKTTPEDLLQRVERGQDFNPTDDNLRALAEARMARRTATRQ